MLTFPEDFIEAPVGNTGLNCKTVSPSIPIGDSGRFEVGLHWLNGTLPIFPSEPQTVREVAEWIAGIFNDRWIWEDDFPRKRGKTWQHGVASVFKNYICWNEPDFINNKPGEMFISINGESFDSIDFSTSIDLLQVLHLGWGFKCSIIHVYLDDYLKALTYDQLKDAGENRNMRYPLMMNPRPGIFNPRLGWMGWSVGFGSPASESKFLFYEKSKESFGERDCHRLEAKFSKKKACEFFKKLCQIDLNSDGWITNSINTLAGAVLGSIEFLDRSDKDLRASDCPRLSWWNDFIEAVNVETYRVKKPVCKPTFEAKIAWVHRTWSVTLAMFKNWIGESLPGFIESLIDDGNRRMKPHHHAMLEVAMNSG
jgi:hypothetical protein